MFNESSGLVKIWIRLLNDKNSQYTTENIPNISNLREVILKELEK